MKRILFLMVGAALLLCSCGKSTSRTLTSASGSIYEALIVMDDSLWNGEPGEMVRSVMAADMVCMPQMEPLFKVSQVSFAEYDDIFKPSRNLLLIDVNPNKYTANKIVYKKDYYAKPQAYCRIQSPSREAFEALWQEKGEQVGEFFVRQELERQGKFYKGYTQTDASKAVDKHFGSEMLIPEDYMLVRDSSDFVWAVNDKGSARRDIMIWSYPYTDEKQLTQEYLIHKRDSIMKSHVRGSLAESYMGTEHRNFPPVFTPISVQDNAYAAEIRGLWRFFGESMGGPFVQHTRIDETTGRVITAEVFVFAPGQTKRNLLRQAEAILYTWKLPQERNALKEVEVSVQDSVQ